MGSFVAILPKPGDEPDAAAQLRQALECSERLGFPRSHSVIERPEACAAVLPRQNGSFSPLVEDQKSRCWVLAAGTWFHPSCPSGGEENLVARYLEVGARRLAREIEGFFLLLIGDPRQGKITVITDIVGSCHGFLRKLRAGTALSSSSLLLSVLERSELDPVGAQEFLATGVIYEDRSLFREVKKLGPARIYVFRNGALESEDRYWRVSALKPNSLHGDAAVEALWESTQHAAKAVADAYPKLICDLTGGHDSRALVGAFLGTGANFSTVVSGPEGSPDVHISSGLAALLGLKHTHCDPPAVHGFSELKKAIPLTDGECDLVEYDRVRQIHQALAANFDISVNGSFGEVARGYWWELIFPWTGKSSKLDAKKVAERRYAVDPADAVLFRQEVRLSMVDHLSDVLERTNTGMFQWPNTLQMDNAYLGMRMQRWQGRLASSTNRIWPCISPFMFRSVLEVMLQTETALRRRGLLVRKMLARFQPRLSGYPLDFRYPAAPLTWRNWHKFCPALVPYSRKAVEKLLGGVGFGFANGNGTCERSRVRLMLWQAEEVQDVLAVEKMQLAGILNIPALATFLRASRKDRFPYEKLWTRLLSLELTLREQKRTS